ncbi:MAG: hypothetical protein OEV92_01205 [Nitrospinota bacterium]|nr:hypothetical protein [Nitrospinota bacterium]
MRIYVQLAPTANVKGAALHVPSLIVELTRVEVMATHVTFSGAVPALLSMVSVSVTVAPIVTLPNCMGLGVAPISGAAFAGPAWASHPASKRAIINGEQARFIELTSIKKIFPADINIRFGRIHSRSPFFN